MNEAGDPLPGACFSVVLGLRGVEVPPGIDHLDQSSLRAGEVVLEVCDAGVGRSGGVLTVGGTVAEVERDIAAVLDGPDVELDQVQFLESTTLTIDLIQTRSPDATGVTTDSRPLLQVAITLADLGSDGSVRLVYGDSKFPVTLSPDEVPAASDGTEIIE